MPNHVTNVITADSDVLASLLNDKGEIDFGVLIPMPKCLEDYNPHGGIETRVENLLGLEMEGLTESLEWDSALEKKDWKSLGARMHALNRIRDANKPINPDDLDSVIRGARNYLECGHISWYTWSIEHWGTKWNAYEHSVSDESLRFQTAWSIPAPVIECLIKQHPRSTVLFEWADEDLGNNCGVMEARGGEILALTTAADQPSNRNWKKFAFELIYPGKDPADHSLNENYEYDESLDVA